MKKLLFLLTALLYLLLVLSYGCATTPKPETVLKSDYLILVDSIKRINLREQHTKEVMVTLQDSIKELLERPLMTADQFIKLYKYESLVKYHAICKKNPSQKKYHWGWTCRVIEQ